MLGPWATVEMPPVSSDPSTTQPPLAPSNPLAAPSVELLAVNHSSVLVTWEDRGPATGRQMAQSVALTYRILGGRDTSQRLLLPASGAHSVGGLKAGNVYEFQLVATSGSQEGPASTRTIRTLWETASGMENEMEDGLDFDQGPVHLEASVLSSSAIHLKWKSVEHADGILFYTVRYLAIFDSSPPQTKISYIRSTATDVTLRNLTAHTLYQISVRSHDREGRLGAFSTPPIEKRTLPDVPGVPSDVSWLITPEDRIELTWRPPFEPNGDIISYAILISTDRHAPIEEWAIQEEPGTKYRAQLRNLTVDVPHLVRMQARTRVGWGPLTEPITVELRNTPVIPATPSTRTDLPAGVIIGLIIALCLTLVVVMSLMLTRRCSKVHSNNRPSSGSPAAVSIDASMPCRPSAGVNVANGGVAAGNGYAGGRAKDRMKNHRQPGTLVEMEAFFPMLSTIPGDAPADLDTKVTKCFVRFVLLGLLNCLIIREGTRRVWCSKGSRSTFESQSEKRTRTRRRTAAKCRFWRSNGPIQRLCRTRRRRRASASTTRRSGARGGAGTRCTATTTARCTVWTTAVGGRATRTSGAARRARAVARCAATTTTTRASATRTIRC